MRRPSDSVDEGTPLLADLENGTAASRPGYGPASGSAFASGPGPGAQRYTSRPTAQYQRATFPDDLHNQFVTLIGLPHPSTPQPQSQGLFNFGSSKNNNEDTNRNNQPLYPHLYPLPGATPLYTRAKRKHRRQSRIYLLTASINNLLLLSQVILGAALTGLGASNSSHIYITLFGAANTVIAGIIAYMKSRGQPMRSRMFRDDLERVVDEIENSEIMWLGIARGAHGYDEIDVESEVSVRSEVARLTRLFDRAVRNNTFNNPDMYSVGGGGGGEMNLRAKGGPGMQMPPLAAAPREGPAVLEPVKSGSSPGSVKSPPGSVKSPAVKSPAPEPVPTAPAPEPSRSSPIPIPAAPSAPAPVAAPAPTPTPTPAPIASPAAPPSPPAGLPLAADIEEGPVTMIKRGKSPSPSPAAAAAASAEDVPQVQAQIQTQGGAAGGADGGVEGESR